MRVPCIECPRTSDGRQLFPCVTPPDADVVVCIDEHALCDDVVHCPNGEDEDATVCMFHRLVCSSLTRVYARLAEKNCTPNSWPEFCQIITDLHNSFTGKFSSKFAVKWLGLLRIPPHLAYVATLPCVTNINVRKQATSDKLQGIVNM